MLLDNKMQLILAIRFRRWKSVKTLFFSCELIGTWERAGSGVDEWGDEYDYTETVTWGAGSIEVITDIVYTDSWTSWEDLPDMMVQIYVLSGMTEAEAQALVDSMRTTAGTRNLDGSTLTLISSDGQEIQYTKQ